MLLFLFYPTVGGLSHSIVGECQDQDKKVNILNLSTGKTIQYFKPEGDVGEPLKVLYLLPEFYRNEKNASEMRSL